MFINSFFTQSLCLYYSMYTREGFAFSLLPSTKVAPSLSQFSSCMGQYVTTVLSSWDLGFKKTNSLLLGITFANKKILTNQSRASEYCVLNEWLNFDFILMISQVTITSSYKKSFMNVPEIVLLLYNFYWDIEGSFCLSFLPQY